jgi:hypothetical protein
MRCDDLRLIQAWILGWRDCGVAFEIVPVGTSAETRAVVEPYLEPQWTAWSNPLRVDNVTLWVHPWSAAATCGRIREEIETDVSFAL